MAPTFLEIFIPQFFNIGKSSYSILQEVINLIRTFQRLGASKSFSIRLSNDCNQVINWVSYFVNDILSAILNELPLSEFECFSLYSQVFPIILLTIFATLDPIPRGNIANLLFASFPPGLFLIGMGFSFITTDKAAYLISFSLGIVFFVILVIWSICCRKDEDEYEEDCFDKLIDYKAILKTGTVLIGVMLPFCLYRFILTILLYVFVFLVFIIYLIIKCYNKKKNKNKAKNLIESKINLLMDCFSLLIVPSAQKFSELHKYDFLTYDIITILAFTAGILVPLSINFSKIILDVNEENHAYRETRNSCLKNPFVIFEFLDNLKQAIYAICAGYGYTWICIFLESLWSLSLVIFLPYKKISEYFVQWGTSLLLLIQNCVVKYAETHDSGVFNHKLSLFFVFFACIPAILAMPIYFIFDFKIDLQFDDKSEINEKHLYDIFVISKIALPIEFLCYGLSMGCFFYNFDDYN